MLVIRQPVWTPPSPVRTFWIAVGPLKNTTTPDFDETLAMTLEVLTVMLKLSRSTETRTFSRVEKFDCVTRFASYWQAASDDAITQQRRRITAVSTRMRVLQLAQCFESGRRRMTQSRDDTDGVPVGNGQHISPAEFLLMAGFLVYRAPLASADARAAARRVLVAVLEVATARGFARFRCSRSDDGECRKVFTHVATCRASHGCCRRYGHVPARDSQRWRNHGCERMKAAR